MKRGLFTKLFSRNLSDGNVEEKGTQITLNDMIFADNKFLKTFEFIHTIQYLFSVFLFNQTKKSFLIIRNQRSRLTGQRSNF